MTQPTEWDDDAYPDRVGFKNFTWTLPAIAAWETVWHSLWAVGVKWEWQNTDRYARRYGNDFNLFSVHNDAVRLDMAIPLPQLDTIHHMANWLLGASVDDHMASHSINLIRKFIKDYVD
jgi:hypothetical protein|tara:strand:- start:271 stop:627 length:357 start_codon:yes stop_codon:yes gene_type:complete